MALHLPDEAGIGAVENRQVRGFARCFHQFAQIRVAFAHEIAVRYERAADAVRLQADVPQPVFLRLIHKAHIGQRIEQPMRGGRRQAGALGDFGERDAAFSLGQFF